MVTWLLTPILLTVALIVIAGLAGVSIGIDVAGYIACVCVFLGCQFVC